MFIKLINEGEKREIIIGGRPIIVKEGENWFPRGTAEFITSKVANTKIVGAAVECEEDGSPIGSIKQEAIIPEEITAPADEIILSEPKVITSEKIKITEEDKAKYEEELKDKTKKELTDILDFKGIKYAKNLKEDKLIKLIINSLK